MQMSDTHTDRARGKKVRQCRRTSAWPTVTAQHPKIVMINMLVQG